MCPIRSPSASIPLSDRNGLVPSWSIQTQTPTPHQAMVAFSQCHQCWFRARACIIGDGHGDGLAESGLQTGRREVDGNRGTNLLTITMPVAHHRVQTLHPRKPLFLAAGQESVYERAREQHNDSPLRVSKLEPPPQTHFKTSTVEETTKLRHDATRLLQIPHQDCDQCLFDFFIDPPAHHRFGHCIQSNASRMRRRRPRQPTTLLSHAAMNPPRWDDDYGSLLHERP